jgi:FtsH-binding integral membrane protein
MTFRSLIVEQIVPFLQTYILPLFFSAAFLVFIFGIVKYIFKGDSPDGRATGSKFMIAGLIGLFVMFSVWGLVALLTNFFGGGLGIPQF